ncbi:aspartyl-phosphate phosphatase Spo0E family protein [Melghirimyces algeriensis]|uniref:Spo0E like sporulation regulatory protein n=1 Tax=Melghirimyces algeriensis TaxID=910412 RepID=A0A521EFL6_9BACL|nr:aspartyl-phosphate phosphatase Spo0E family protein [Melghirimyces algeriensis]SMO82695.1 Spo0E like sporulation regulatory protein [Melghirimyces algeriensis]
MYKYQLEEEMERLRAFMYTKASQLGLNHPTVIQISQRLDELHNQWNREQGLHSKKKDQQIYFIQRYSSNIREAVLHRA